MVRIICGHHNWIAVAYAQFVVCYRWKKLPAVLICSDLIVIVYFINGDVTMSLSPRVKESTGWQQVFTSPRLDWVIDRVALNAKVMAGSLGDNDKMVAVASGTDIILWSICPDGNGNEIGASLGDGSAGSRSIDTPGSDAACGSCLDFLSSPSQASSA